VSPLLLALLVTQATVYAWTDKAGVEHFTDDLSTIPRGVKVRTTDGAEISVLVIKDKDENKAEKKTEAPAPPSAPSGPEAPSVAELTWRQLFRDARKKVTVLEEEIEADRLKVEEVSGLPLSFGLNCGFYGGGYYGGYRPGYFPGAARVPPVNSTGVAVTATGQPIPGVSVGATVTGTTVIVPPTVSTGFVTPYPSGYGTPCGYAFSPEFAMIRDRLDRNRRELPRAREELADLERRASFEAVPLEWRR
jgi:hypothetical protein